MKFQQLSMIARNVLYHTIGSKPSGVARDNTIFRTEVDVLSQLRRSVADARGLQIDNVDDHQPITIVWPIVQQLLEIQTPEITTR